MTFQLLTSLSSQLISQNSFLLMTTDSFLSRPCFFSQTFQPLSSSSSSSQQKSRKKNKGEQEVFLMSEGAAEGAWTEEEGGAVIKT